MNAANWLQSKNGVSETGAERQTICVSLCICTMNRANDLRNCLAAAINAAPPPDEIVVSDDSRDDAKAAATQAVAEAFPGVIYQRGPRRGLGANRNACLDRATGTHIHFTDDDVTVPPDFYAQAKILLAELPRTIVTGDENRHDGVAVYRVSPHNADFWGFQQAPPQGHYRAIVINGTLFPAELFQSARFDEHLRYGSDEIDISRHALAEGFPIGHTDQLVVDHFPSPVNRDIYNRFIDASRLYTTTKAYWRYERAPLRTLAYVALAPLHLLGSALKSRNRSRITGAFGAIGLAARYLLTRPQTGTSSVSASNAAPGESRA